MIDNPLALDLLSKMLALDPRERVTAKEALRHDFFKPLSRKQELMMMGGGSSNEYMRGGATSNMMGKFAR